MRPILAKPPCPKQVAFSPAHALVFLGMEAGIVQSTNVHNGMAMLLQRRGQMWPRCVSVQHVAQLDKLVLTINSQAFPDVTCGEILREINIILHRL